jgi:hypothetical protein
MLDGQLIYVSTPFPKTPARGTCCWCGGSFHGDGDWRCISMLTDAGDGDFDWLSGNYIHGECDYARKDATERYLHHHGGAGRPDSKHTPNTVS